MTEGAKQKEAEEIPVSFGGQGSPTRPIHITASTWAERTKLLEDNIRDEVPFEGQWQSYIEACKLFIPTELQHLFTGGGVVTVSTENHLLLFGQRHWARYQRLLAKEVGLSPVNNEVARHIYSNMHRFNKINEDGSITLTPELIRYADFSEEVAIIGLIYHAELHDKSTYVASQNPIEQRSRIDRFKKLKLS